MIEDVRFGEDHVEITCSPAASIMALGRGSLTEQTLGEGLTRAVLPLAKVCKGGFVRIAVADANRRRAWTNPVWFD